MVCIATPAAASFDSPDYVMKLKPSFCYIYQDRSETRPGKGFSEKLDYRIGWGLG